MEGFEIIEKLRELSMTPSKWRLSDLPCWKKSSVTSEDIINWNIEWDKSFGPIECVDNYGGEDEGSRHWFVIYFPEHDVYLKAEGYYQSYYGSDYSGVNWEVVRPKKIETTIYE